MKKKLTIVKVGGNIVENESSLAQLLADFTAIEGDKILVHGGGKVATRYAEQLGIEVKMVEGRRITDEEMLKVVTMIYGGLVNKNVVAGLQSANCNAIGLTGADMNVILADKRPVKTIDYGFVGDVRAINGKALQGLLGIGAVPVLAPLTHNGNGLMLNTNADTIAQSVAVAMSEWYEVQLLFCFDKAGVQTDINDENSLIPLITKQMFADLKAQKIIVDGMIAKLENCFTAIDSGVNNIVLCKADAIAQTPVRGTRLVFEE